MSLSCGDGAYDRRLVAVVRLLIVVALLDRGSRCLAAIGSVSRNAVVLGLVHGGDERSARGRG
jgi:hypothetical protein